MDGQTDRILIARPRLHSMQRGKNELQETGTPVRWSGSIESIQFFYSVIFTHKLDIIRKE